MRKRTFATKREKVAIKDWLNNPDKSGCPFPLSQIIVGKSWCEICYGYFPTLRERARDVLCECPCAVYGKRYTVRVAKEILCLP